MNRITGMAVPRRLFLQAAGVGLALPLLESMTPALAKAPKESETPRRFLGICNNLGVLPEHFFPQGTGRDYEASTYLKLLERHRNDFTVFSGVSHPDVDGGHPADICFLTAAPSLQRWLPQHDLARPVHRRTDRHQNPLSLVDAGR